uniref:Uncharacterized protein n=1 Tax=Leersia perrieri TaxID=77586 RepID=A0A0D9W321_9ORYZ
MARWRVGGRRRRTAGGGSMESPQHLWTYGVELQANQVVNISISDVYCKLSCLYTIAVNNNVSNNYLLIDVNNFACIVQTFIPQDMQN